MSERASLLTGIQKIPGAPCASRFGVQIKSLVLANQLRPGQPIVIDRLAAELGVSHTPVREALAMLEHDGWVTMRPYENPRVALIDASYVREAWQMRVLLEGWGINRATISLAADALDEMESRLATARSEARQSRFDTHLKTDLALHEMILRAAGNRLYVRMAQLVNDQSIRARALVEAIASTDDVLQIIDEHCAIVEALRSRDPDRAHQCLLDHLEAGKQRTLAALETIQAGEP